MRGDFQARRQNRMLRVDLMPAEMRALVHEYGLHVVQALLDAGVTKPARIRHIVETVLDEFSPTRATSSAQGGPRTRLSFPDYNESK